MHQGTPEVKAAREAPAGAGAESAVVVRRAMAQTAAGGGGAKAAEVTERAAAARAAQGKVRAAAEAPMEAHWGLQ